MYLSDLFPSAGTGAIVLAHRNTKEATLEKATEPIDKFGGQSVPLKPTSIRLSFLHLRIGMKHGNGVLSDGVRKALEHLDKESKKP